MKVWLTYLSSIHNEDPSFIRKFRPFAGKINKIEQNYKDCKLNCYFGFPFNVFGYFLGTFSWKLVWTIWTFIPVITKVSRVKWSYKEININKKEIFPRQVECQSDHNFSLNESIGCSGFFNYLSKTIAVVTFVCL